MRLLLMFSIPVLLGNLFQQLYTLTDTVIVSRRLRARSPLGISRRLLCVSAGVGARRCAAGAVVFCDYAAAEKNTGIYI